MTDIVFVDENDVVIGSGPKEEAYRKGIRHRTSRIFLTNARGEILLVRRSFSLPVLPGRWGESVAGHVDAGEDYMDAAQRELAEELNLTNIVLSQRVKYYTEHFDGERHFKRFNVLFCGTYDGEIFPDPSEVAEIKWLLPSRAARLIEESVDDFTPGCVQAVGVYITHESPS